MATRKTPTDSPDPAAGVPPAVFSFLVELSGLLLAGGVSASTLKELSLRAYVQAACEATAKTGRKPNKAVIAAMTGLSRVEVTRLLEASAQQHDQPLPSPSRATRVLDGWRSDPEFNGVAGEPLPLPLRGRAMSFEVLVRRYSGDMTPQAMLRELMRLELAEVIDGMVRPMQGQIGSYQLQTLDALIQSLRPVVQSVSADKSTRSDVRATTLDVSLFHPITQKLLLKHLKTAVPRFLETARATAEVVPAVSRTRSAPTRDRVSISVIVTDTKTQKPKSRA
jgi:hypothetical protein